MTANRELLWLRRVRDLCHALATEADVAALPDRILAAAVELTEAERGFLVLVLGRKPDGGYRLNVKAARGFDQAGLRRDPRHVSRTVVERVLDRADRGLVTTSEEDGDVLQATSVQARGVRSIICAPLRLRGELRGVLYLDHRVSEQAFTGDDLPLLQTFADQAAVALEAAERRAEQGEPAPASPESVEGYGALLGGSPAMRALYAQLERVARSDDPVLILGESGVGKELVARELHRRGAAPEAPFLSESCAALADTLLETELFGHRRGAFTGATEDRLGLFREAGCGSLFLDEVGEMSPALQAKLLRVLQERVVRPVGGEKLAPIFCRLIAATHRDLQEQVQAGAFREDLYYRLDVLRIVVPPLRERPEDIPLLVRHFLGRLGAGGVRLSSRALDLLGAYAWPGNVRQLENELRRLVALGEQRIGANHLSPEVQRGRGVSHAGGPLAGKTLGEVEREMVAAALETCGGNKARAARQLGIPRSTLYGLLERYGLE